MATFSPESSLQHLMNDLHQREKALAKQLVAFEALRQDVVALQRRSPTDAQARQRLDGLSRAMGGELAPMNERLRQCAEKLMAELQVLEAVFQAGAGAATGKAESKRKSSQRGQKYI
ncbi:hypothetical protein [Paraburkholderia sp. RL17-373-BIF-A]|uniref:hypothetical protein n=1 Tax=Paraburkholderia sp. RL17-373-BIF-A TaxID=3031629 RepID=UPI0038B8137E